MPLLSVVCCTKRAEPRFNWIKESLKLQEFQDFEFILINGLAEKRSRQVLEFFKDVPFNFTCLPDKPNRWLGIRTALANSRNTAFIFANGQQVVFFDDCSRLDRHFTERHAKWAGGRMCVAGTWCSYETPWNEGPYGLEYRSNPKTGLGIRDPQPCSADWLYGANFSVPLKAALDVNGNDELYCGEMGVEDCDFGIRIGRAGYQTIFDPQCKVNYMVSPEDAATKVFESSGKKPVDLVISGNTEVKVVGGWEAEKRRRPKELVLEDGKKHLANEFLIQLIHKQSERFWTLGNAFSLVDLRQKWQNYKQYKDGLERFWKVLEDWKFPLEYDWRDGQKIDSMRTTQQPNS